MTEIYPICAKYNVAKPKELTAPEQQTINRLDDLVKVVKALEAVKKAAEEMSSVGKTLSSKALEIYGKAKVEDPSAIIRIIKTLAGAIQMIEALPAKEQGKLAEDKTKLAKMLEIMSKATEEAASLNFNLSQEGRNIYLDTAAAVNEPTATKTLIKTLELTAEKMAAALPEETKVKLGITAENKIPQYSQLAPLIITTCTPAEQVVVVEPVKDDKEKKKPVKVDGSAYLRPGYAHQFGKGSPDAGKGILVGGGASGAVIFDEATKLQLDYKTFFSYDVEGEDNLMFNRDDADLSIMHKREDVDMLVKAGYLSMRNDYPSVVAPNYDAGTQDLYLNYRINKRLTFDLGEEAAIGGVETEYEKGNAFYFAGRIFPGITLHLSSAALTLGAVAGWSTLLGGELGGQAGVACQKDEHEFAALFRISGWQGLVRVQGGLEYYYKDIFGIRALYERIRVSDAVMQDANLLFAWKIRLPKEFILEPFIGGGVSGSDKEIAPMVSGGLAVRFRSLMPQAPDFLTPFSTDPLRGDY